MSTDARLNKLPFRPGRRGWILIAVAGVVLSSYAADAVASVGHVRAGVKAGGIALGGRSGREAEELLTQTARKLSAEPVAFFADSHRVAVHPDDVGFFPDVDATLDAAMAVGRHPNLFVRFWQRLRSHFTDTDIGWRSQLDPESSQALVAAWAERFDDPGHEAGIEATGTRFMPVAPVPGRTLHQRRAMGTLERGLETWPRRSLDLPFSVQNRRTDLADAEDAAEAAEELVRGPVTLTSTGAETIELSPKELAPLLEAVPQRRAGGWALRVRFAPDGVAEALAAAVKPFERVPRSAGFAVNGASVRVVGGETGLAFDPQATAEALDDAARQDAPRTASIAFAEREPEMTTAQAEALNIHELVSTFTTEHKCCQPRVKNIHRMADIVDGAIVKPGATFSLNGHVGKRTTEKGFVLAPMIFDGEYKDDVGGGVSQFATTMYNAVFFGDHRFETFKAHSYYISRYPPGREATVSWPAPDLKFTNTSQAGVLVKTAYSNTSITVSFYGDKGGKTVTSESGERTNFTEPTEQRKPNPALGPGEEKVVQKGGQGFDIVVYRVVSKDGDVVKRERFFTRYRPEPRIIEVGPGTPPPASPGPGQPREPATPGPTATPAPSP